MNASTATFYAAVLCDFDDHPEFCSWADYIEATVADSDELQAHFKEMLEEGACDEATCRLIRSAFVSDTQWELLYNALKERDDESDSSSESSDDHTGEECELCDKTSTHTMGEYQYCDEHHTIEGKCHDCQDDIHTSWDFAYIAQCGNINLYCRRCAKTQDPCDDKMQCDDCHAKEEEEEHKGCYCLDCREDKNIAFECVTCKHTFTPTNVFDAECADCVSGYHPCAYGTPCDECAFKGAEDGQWIAVA